MANHGYCINCWWYLLIKGRYYITTKTGLKEKLGNGKCYMHNSDEGNFTTVEGDCYCPDYVNRIKEEKRFGKLDDWIDKF